MKIFDLTPKVKMNMKIDHYNGLQLLLVVCEGREQFFFVNWYKG